MIDSWTAGASLITGIGTLAILVVWGLYAKMAFDQYRESRRPWFIIENAGPEADTPCYLVNMGQQTAHVAALLVVAQSSDRRVARRVRRAKGSGSDEVPPLHENRLGPVPAGSTLLIGSFSNLFDELIAQEFGGSRDDPHYRDIECEIRVIAESIVDQEGPVGASRSFTVQDGGDGNAVVQPLDMTTRQLRTADERRRVRGWLESVWQHDGFSNTWELPD